nr:MgtC/SapB family protein [Paenibacillus aestuarii]
MNEVLSLWHITHGELLLRMFIAVVLGGLVGIEREWNHHAAGFRTHILVCLGSALIMLLSIYGFSDFVTESNVRMDPARLAAQVISGIGFLGAGAILRNGSVISGLTTAASIWVVAGIGLCVGAGFLYAAFICTLLVLISLLLLNKWENYLMRHRRKYEIKIKAYDQPGIIGQVTSALEEHGIQMDTIKIEHEIEKESKQRYVLLCFQMKSSHHEKFIAALEQIQAFHFVSSVESGSTPFLIGKKNQPVESNMQV